MLNQDLSDEKNLKMKKKVKDCRQGIDKSIKKYTLSLCSFVVQLNAGLTSEQVIWKPAILIE